jgi:MtrB/PioB family decaheme-associated outer membrane protein
LPSGSLNGLVITKHADLKLTNQTSKDLLLSAGVKYNERDNQTPSNVFDSFASIAGDPWGPVANAPVSNKKLQVELDGSYRIDKKQTLRLSYAYDDVKRWCNNALANNFQSSDVLTNVPNYYTTTACVQSPQSRENKLAANYRLKAGQGVNFTAGYSYAKRRADFNTSYYNPMQTSAEGLQNFGFVPYFDASRRDQIVKSGLNWQANDRFNLGLTGRFIDTKYDSTLGVQKGHGLALNLDAAYNYAAGGVVSAYLSGQRRQRDLLSSADKSPLVAPGNLWSNHLDEDSNTLGITAKHRGLMGGRLDLTGDLSYSLSKTTYSTQLQDPTQCTDINCGDLPVIKNEVLRLKFTGVYHVDKASKVALSGLYQKLKSDDYYYSAYQLGYTDVTVLPTNQLAPNHSVTAAGISYIYSFR